MNVIPSLQADVRDLLFADWAEVVTFVEVSAIYDPQNGQTLESVAETDLLAIAGPGWSKPVPNTAHQHTRSERTFLIRAEDLPVEASFSTSRIRSRGREYSILTADEAPQSNLIVFHALARE